MTSRVPIVVIRHPKERISKCSLRSLHGREDVTFLRATGDLTFDGTGHLLLSVNAPPLTADDRGHPLLLLDSSWRWLPKLERRVTGEPIRRSIPAGVRTAYPRKSRVFDDPDDGLASIEALYVAKRILGDDDPSLLEGYHWREEFLRQFEPAES